MHFVKRVDRRLYKPTNGNFTELLILILLPIIIITATTKYSMENQQQNILLTFVFKLYVFYMIEADK